MYEPPSVAFILFAGVSRAAKILEKSTSAVAVIPTPRGPDVSNMLPKFWFAANPIPAPNVFVPLKVWAAPNVWESANLESLPNVFAPSKSCIPASKSPPSPNVSSAPKSEPAPNCILPPEKSWSTPESKFWEAANCVPAPKFWPPENCCCWWEKSCWPCFVPPINSFDTVPVPSALIADTLNLKKSPDSRLPTVYVVPELPVVAVTTV